MRQHHHSRQIAFLFCLAGFVFTSRAEEPFDYKLYESPARPSPEWVKMVDLGDRDPSLKGYRAAAGVKVEVVAHEPDVINPVGMRFDQEGNLLLLDWHVGRSIQTVDSKITFKDGSTLPTNLWIKDVPDSMVKLSPEPDGFFKRTSAPIEDLQLPSSLLFHDGWIYFTERGSVVRRKPTTPGGPYDIQETIIHGLAGFNQHQASGLSLSPDGWLYVTHGDDDTHAETADGTRATLLRNGAVWRLRPDGTGLQLFARGFRNPYRDVVWDEFGNIFHADNDNEDGSKFQGCRLMHVMEEADYGWRLKPSVRCCWPDADRGAIFGERAGRMPPMVKTGRGAPAGVMVYEGNAFPEFFRGLIVYPDVFQRNVRCYRVARDGSTFKVTQQFTLLTTTDGLFRPCQAIQGPDGAIYLCDWRNNSAGAAAAWGDGQHGRIWRLSWEGSPLVPDAPAITLGPIDSWAHLASADDVSLLKLLAKRDLELRSRALDELIRHGEKNRNALLAIAEDLKQPPFARAAAISGVSRLWNADVLEAMLSLLKDENLELRRMAAEEIDGNVAAAQVTDSLIQSLAADLLDPQPAPRRAAALAIGRAASLLPEANSLRAKAADTLFSALRKDDRSDRFLHDGILRALERLGKTGTELLASAALSDDAGTRSFGIGELECLRTRVAADAFDRVLSTPNKLDDAQLARLLTAYRYIQVEPAINPAVLSQWLETHTAAPAATQVAALESLALVGEMDPAQAMPAVLRLLNSPAAATRLAVIKVIGEQHLLAAAKPLMSAAADKARSDDERRAILQALGNLRGQRRFAQVAFDPGVDGCVDDLAALAGDTSAGPIRRDALALLAQIDFHKAEPVAMKLVESADFDDASAAVGILGTDAGAARQMAQNFVDGKLAPALLPQVAGALQRYVGRSPELADLRAKVLKRGMLAASDPESVKRLEELVQSKGDAIRGRALFLDRNRLACVTCHRLEGVGGEVGPDLTKLYLNVTLPKLIESILEPSKEIKEGYQTYIVATNDGQVYEGLKMSTDVQRTVLRDGRGKNVTILATNIKRMTVSKISLMPEGLTASLKLEEFADLLAFLRDGKVQATLRP